MQSISQENFSHIIANICSCFVDKCDSKCYNKTPSSTLGGALYDLFQRLIRTGLLYLPSNKTMVVRLSQPFSNCSFCH